MTNLVAQYTMLAGLARIGAELQDDREDAIARARLTYRMKVKQLGTIIDTLEKNGGNAELAGELSRFRTQLAAKNPDRGCPDIEVQQLNGMFLGLSETFTRVAAAAAAGPVGCHCVGAKPTAEALRKAYGDDSRQ